MSTPKKRSYKSSVRKDQASKTKSRILSSAKKLFQSKGFEEVTIKELADLAEVSAPTVYSLYKSKRGVLLALIDEALPTTTFEALVEAVKKEKSAAEKLRIAAKMTRLIYDAEQEQLGFFREASMLGPELQRIEEEQEVRRYERQEETVRSMYEEKLLSDKVKLLDARDILWALTGRDMYRNLVVVRSWSSDKYEEWLGEALVKLLVD